MPIDHKAVVPRKMAMGDIQRLLGADLKAVEEAIRHHYQSDVAMIPLVSDHLTNGGGKRLRPMLVLLSSYLCGAESCDKAVIHSTVVEYIHAATLLHDDVVDDSGTRRGLPSANAKFGNPVSVLVGDYLFAKSFALMAAHSSKEIIRAVSDATRSLAEGEVLQLMHIGNIEMTEEQHLDVVYRKTGALIMACCEIGGWLGCATPEQRRALASFGKNIGIAFQLVDDLLDFTADQRTLGKPVGQDLAEGHVTLPVIHAWRNIGDAEKNFLRETIKNEELTRQRMPAILDIINKNDGIGYAARLAEQYVENAMAELEILPGGAHQEALAGLADYIIVRTH